MYIHIIDNHTIKYESQSLVVGDGVAYNEFLNLLALAKITGNSFADLSPHLATVKISWWYLRRFNSNRVDKRTHKQTDTTEHNYATYHYAIVMRVVDQWNTNLLVWIEIRLLWQCTRYSEDVLIWPRSNWVSPTTWIGYVPTAIARLQSEQSPMQHTNNAINT